MPRHRQYCVPTQARRKTAPQMLILPPKNAPTVVEDIQIQKDARKTCRKCQKRNHFAVKCRSRKAKVRVVDEEDQTQEEDNDTPHSMAKVS